MKSWHSITVEDIFSKLSSSEAGLSEREAAVRLRTYGRNELPEDPGHPSWFLFVSQFRSPLMYIMMAAVAVSLFLGNRIEAVFIFVVMISNALVGFYQEHKANKSVKALKGIIRLTARVIRDDREREIDAAEVVPGDILILRPGDKVPADGRILEHRGLKMGEGSLTGESKPVEKTISVFPEAIELADRTNMVFMGTLVEEGSGNVLVVETGPKTEYGDIVSLLKETAEETTPLQKTVVYLSKIVGIFITCVVGFIVLEGFATGQDVRTIFEAALALFVSAIPEGLLPAITIVLVLGMRRILQRKGLVRRLAATETLGGVTVICTDKTGTLTEGKMEAELLVAASGTVPVALSRSSVQNSGIDMIIRVSVLATDAYVENPRAPLEQLVIRGTFTEQALLRMAISRGVDTQSFDAAEPLIDRLFFSSELKYSATLRHTASRGAVLYVLGAPEQLLQHISFVHTEEGKRGIESEDFKRLIGRKDELVDKGYRVIACAYRSITASGEHSIEGGVRDLILAGFVAITDPVRAEVPEALAKTSRAGIRTVIITGDHALTARAVAETIGFHITPEQMLEGHQIEAMSDSELRTKVKTVALYARVSPRHKLRIVHAFQKNGEVVAMFGDGVNDAPALKAADIGVAVGTKVPAAREVADLVLLDGGFSTIVEAIEQGRIIFSNIRKVFLYLITQDFSQFLLFILSILFGLPLPLLAVQLLLVNLVESGLPDLALTTEQEKEGVMEEPPRNPKESILNDPSRRWMISIFYISGGIAMLFYLAALTFSGSLEKARTMMTVFLCFESLFLVFSVRSFTRPIIRRDIFSNKILFAAVLISLGMVLCAVYVPALQKTLSMLPLSPVEWLVIVLINVAEVLLIDFFKLRIFRKKR